MNTNIQIIEQLSLLYALDAQLQKLLRTTHFAYRLMATQDLITNEKKQMMMENWRYVNPILNLMNELLTVC